MTCRLLPPSGVLRAGLLFQRTLERPYFSWAGWSDYAAKNGIGCTPGTAVKGGDGIVYVCQ